MRLFCCFLTATAVGVPSQAQVGFPPTNIAEVRAAVANCIDVVESADAVAAEDTLRADGWDESPVFTDGRMVATERRAFVKSARPRLTLVTDRRFPEFCSVNGNVQTDFDFLQAEIAVGNLIGERLEGAIIGPRLLGVLKRGGTLQEPSVTAFVYRIGDPTQ